MLQQTHGPSRKKAVSVDDVLLSVVDEGPLDGVPVLLSHSIMTNLNMWSAQRLNLLENDYRVIRYDSRGHGQSTTGSADYSMDLLAKDVIKVLDALRIEKCHFVGLSLGGIIGFALLRDHPDRLLSAVICDIEKFEAFNEVLLQHLNSSS